MKIAVPRDKGCRLWRNKTNVFDDKCAVNIRTRQSTDTGDYQVDNFYRRCGQPVMTECLTDQTFTFPKVYGFDQCNMDQDSILRYAPLTNLNNIYTLNTRPYVAPPYKGPGANSLHLKDLESSLIHQQNTYIGKAMEPTQEQYIDRFQYLPEYGNPQRVQHTIEPWTRGGILSRELVRRLSYDDYCNMLGKSSAY